MLASDVQLVDPLPVDEFAGSIPEPPSIEVTKANPLESDAELKEPLQSQFGNPGTLEGIGGPDASAITDLDSLAEVDVSRFLAGALPTNKTGFPAADPSVAPNYGVDHGQANNTSSISLFDLVADEDFAIEFAQALFGEQAAGLDDSLITGGVDAIRTDLITALIDGGLTSEALHLSGLGGSQAPSAQDIIDAKSGSGDAIGGLAKGAAYQLGFGESLDAHLSGKTLDLGLSSIGCSHSSVSSAPSLSYVTKVAELLGFKHTSTQPLPGGGKRLFFDDVNGELNGQKAIVTVNGDDEITDITYGDSTQLVTVVYSSDGSTGEYNDRTGEVHRKPPERVAPDLDDYRAAVDSDRAQAELQTRRSQFTDPTVDTANDGLDPNLMAAALVAGWESTVNVRPGDSTEGSPQGGTTIPDSPDVVDPPNEEPQFVGGGTSGPDPGRIIGPIAPDATH